MPTSILSIILPAHVFPAVVKRPVLIGALLWTVSIVYFPVQAVVQFASARPYSLLTNLISDLGNTSCGIGPGTAVTTATRTSCGEAMRCMPWESSYRLTVVVMP